MASNFGVRFFTRGYQRTHREMSSIENKAKAINTGFVRMGRVGTAVGPAIARGIGVLKGSLSVATAAMRMLLSLTIKVSGALVAAGGLISGVGIALTTKFAKGLITTRENFYLIETALTGVVKNAAQVQKISQWAMRYAAAYPAMYEDVMDAMKGLAMMPAMKPIFTKAAVEDMEKIMNIVQGLAALDPQQGVRGALYAIREALAGQWRTLMYRFEIRPQAIAEAAGLTMEELKSSPQLAIKALDAFVRLNVGAETLRKTAESVAIQWGNLSDKYKMWLNTVAQYGAYRRLVEFLMEINDLWGKILKSDAAKRLGQDISRVFEGVIDGINSAISSAVAGIDWEGTGVLSGLIHAAENVIAKIKSIFMDAKETFAAAAKLLFAYMAKASLIVVKEVFSPVGKEIVLTILEGIAAEAKKHPWLSAIAKAVPGGLAGGMTAGPVGAGVGAIASIIALSAAFDKLGKSVEDSRKAMQVRGGEGGWLDRLDAKIKENKRALETGLAFLKKKYGALLPGRKDIETITPAEEQAKRVVELRSKLRIAELTNQKELAATLKSQLAYEERMLDFHRKIAVWERDPARGGREQALKKEIQSLEEILSKEISAGRTRAQFGQKEEQLIKKKLELQKLLAEKQAFVPAIARYTGEELEKRVKETLEKESNLCKKIQNIQQQINQMRKEGVDDISQVVDKEKELLSLQQQKLAVEKQHRGLLQQQLSIQRRLEGLRAGVGVLSQARSYFETFYKGFMEKRRVREMYGAEEIPGMPRFLWQAAGVRSRERETKGIPEFYLRQEEILRRKLEEGGKGMEPTTKKMLLEALYELNVSQFGMARGRFARGIQFEEATEIKRRLMAVEDVLQKEQAALLKQQAKDIRDSRNFLEKANAYLRSIHRNIERSADQQKDTKELGASAWKPLSRSRVLPVLVGEGAY